MAHPDHGERPAEFLRRLFGLEGRAALVTGASGGIGRALAEGFAAAGAAVGLSGTRREQLEALQAAIADHGGRAVALPADLAEQDACVPLVAAARETLGRLDILVNCAGINLRRPAREATPDEFEAIVAVNLRSAFFLCQAVYPVMLEQGGGKIINIGSLTSTTGLGGISIYGATKAGLAQLTKTLALEWARDNIQVNCLAPGFIRTSLTERGLWNDEHRKRWMLERIPAGRPGLPEDLVGTALLLAAPASDYLTGQILTVDGGFTAGGSWLREDE